MTPSVGGPARRPWGLLAGLGAPGAGLGAKRLDPVQDRVRDRLLRGDRDVALLAALDDHHLVLPALEADLGAGYVVEDDRVGALPLELLARALEPGVRLRGEADDRLALAAPRGKRGEDVLGRLQIELEAARPLTVDLRAGSVPGPEVRRSCGHHQDVG